jgi:hypothetical protein
VYEEHVSAAVYAWYCGLGLVQAAVVLLPRAPRPRWLQALRARWLLVVGPAAAVTATTFLPPVASALAASLSTLALLAVPPLAALGIGWAMRVHHPALVLLVPGLLAIAWTNSHGTAGETAGLALVALSVVALAVLVVAILPIRVAKVGIGIWAAVDLSVALAHRLEEASRPIVQATPVVGPHLQLQRVVLGSASMEYADLFVAAALGAVLVAESRRRGIPALLVAAFAMVSSVFFLVADALPATVPIALALLVVEIRAYGSGGGWPFRRRDMRVPPPSARSALTSPPCASATWRTMASPSPDPGMPRADRAR